ncbi:MAG: acetyl-CoA carboxylase, carboxyltransferase subunit beta [bacterium]|nr:acetyl-CoA carboxylase, carboxyltransferase subunit beta [bacterium]
MAWFKREEKGISEETQKRDTPDGLWIKCEGCNEILFKKSTVENNYVCPKCDYHFRPPATLYFQLLSPDAEPEELDFRVRPMDPLGFVDTKKYSERIESLKKKLNLDDTLRVAKGKLDKYNIMIGAMDFEYMGGSLGSVTGEIFARACQICLEENRPLITIACSGGARMQEGALSLMQLAKMSAWLTKLADAKIPFISILTNPTTGGTSASFAMLGDVILAEPGAVIGFAGARVIKQTIGQDLPPGFQRSEFLLEHGFVDRVVHRKDLATVTKRVLRGLIG